MGCVNISAYCCCLKYPSCIYESGGYGCLIVFLRQINRLPNAPRIFARLFVSSHIFSSHASRCSAPIPYQLNNFIMTPNQSMCLPSVQYDSLPIVQMDSQRFHKVNSGRISLASSESESSAENLAEGFVQPKSRGWRPLFLRF